MKTPNKNPNVDTKFTPTKEQINALACRLLPEIKKFFADEQVQKEFEAWKARQTADK